MTGRVNVNSSRRQQILEVLARELETHPGSRITTAGLARAMGVSEAALYRHFPSKARMFEGLISFAEDAVFGLFQRIMEEHPDAASRCEQMLLLMLRFGERNPGISRILAGDALMGENERLRERVTQFFDRVETQFRQVLREAVLAEGPRLKLPVNAAAGLLTGFADGRMTQFLRSGFRATPTAHWQEIWPALAAAVFTGHPGVPAP
ncbi:MAG: nucleoid occlusion factor SlmA [Chromatiales bacterium]